MNAPSEILSGLACCTKEELKNVSGGRGRVTVCRWLNKQGIRFIMGIDNWPKVPRMVILAHLGGIQQAENDEPRLHLP
jgi:hypothetical protein